MLNWGYILAVISTDNEVDHWKGHIQLDYNGDTQKWYLETEISKYTDI